MSRGVRDPDYRRPVVRAAAALWLGEHPHTTEATWELLDQPTRDHWITKAQPILTAVRRTR